MNLFETYILFFTDTLVANFAFNFSNELAIHSVKIFRLHNSYIIIGLASFAFMIASLVNYGFGIICYKILSPMQSDKIQTSAEVNNRIEQLRKSKYLPLFLMLSATPFLGKFIILFGGFCRTPFITTIMIGSFSRFVYYSSVMLLV